MTDLVCVNSLGTRENDGSQRQTPTECVLSAGDAPNSFNTVKPAKTTALPAAMRNLRVVVDRLVAKTGESVGGSGVSPRHVAASSGPLSSKALTHCSIDVDHARVDLL